VSFAEVLGQAHAKAILTRVLTSDRLPHAFLFHGPEGVGKGWIARLFAASVLCTSPLPDGTGCGACASCVRAAHGNHPDLFLVTRLPKKDSPADAGSADPEDVEDATAAKSGDLRAAIVVQQIRELAMHAAYAPREGKRRIFVVDPADRMNAEAQNALLKTLEEPPGRGLIVLVASRPHVLLPTVRSRCFEVGFGAVSPETLAAGLAARGIGIDEAQARAALAEGRPGRAISLDLGALARRRDEILAAISALASSREAAKDLSDVAGAIVGEDETDLVEGLDLLMTLLRDAGRVAAGRPEILHADFAPRIAVLARAIGPSRAMEIVGLIDRLRGELRLNLNKTLVVETILAAIAGGPVGAGPVTTGA
jgi:DNA polymerase-3 subunit delta'